MPAAERLPDIGALPLALSECASMDINHLIEREQVGHAGAAAAAQSGWA